MKIYPPFSGAAASLGAAYFTAVLCGVCGIREWGALIVTVLVGALTCAVVNSVDSIAPSGQFTGLRKRAWGHVPIVKDEVPPLPNIDQDPLAIKIQQAAYDAGLTFFRKPQTMPKWAKHSPIVEYRIEDVCIVEYPANIERKSNDQLEPPL